MTKENRLMIIGINLNLNSTHTARTMMLRELSALLEWVEDPYAARSVYVRAILEENCLQKQSMNNRKITSRHLVTLYSLDPSKPIFRALRFLWSRDEKARPLLALLCACARDTTLHSVAAKVIDLPLNTVITSEDMEAWINELYPNRFSKATLRTLAQNLNSTWTQAGYLRGRVQKTRIHPPVTSGSVAYALFLAYASGFRGSELLESDYFKMLDCPTHDALLLAQEASQRGWMTINRISEVIDVRFPHFLSQKDLELLREQD